MCRILHHERLETSCSLSLHRVVSLRSWDDAGSLFFAQDTNRSSDVIFDALIPSVSTQQICILVDGHSFMAITGVSSCCNHI